MRRTAVRHAKQPPACTHGGALFVGLQMVAEGRAAGMDARRALFFLGALNG